MRRPIFIGAISVAAFVTAIVSMVVVPRATQHPAPPIQRLPRPDTLTVIAAEAIARQRMRSADSILQSRHQQRTADSVALAADTAAMARLALRDSVRLRIARIDSARSRAEQAPLPSSYRAIANLPDLRADPRARILVDSLSEIERERDAFGAIGGVDPAFVALTSRANEIGRELTALASERRRALLATIGDSVTVADTITIAEEDSSVIIAQRDSNRALWMAAQADLARLRDSSKALDADEERQREAANAVAPPLALLASAFVLSAVIGFAVAFVGEIRRPRISSPTELEKVLGVRVIATIEPSVRPAERVRREADRAAPPYVDPNVEGYQLGYLGIATEHPSVLSAIVTGDDPRIAAVVACNLAAIAADEARNTVLLDLEASCAASSVLHARVSPGVSDHLDGESWVDMRSSAAVGRARSIDLIPYGSGTIASEPLVAKASDLCERLMANYDAVLLLASPDSISAGLPRAANIPPVVFCAQPGITPISTLRQAIARIQDAGGVVRGFILWNADRPLLATPREIAARSRPVRRPRNRTPEQPEVSGAVATK